VVRDGGTTNAPKIDKHDNTLNLDFVCHLKNRTLLNYSRQCILNFGTFWLEEDGDSYSKKLVHLYQTTQQHF
jgi:hypothetical protein